MTRAYQKMPDEAGTAAALTLSSGEGQVKAVRISDDEWASEPSKVAPGVAPANVGASTSGEGGRRGSGRSSSRRRITGSGADNVDAVYR